MSGIGSAALTRPGRPTATTSTSAGGSTPPVGASWSDARAIVRHARAQPRGVGRHQCRPARPRPPSALGHAGRADKHCGMAGASVVGRGTSWAVCFGRSACCVLSRRAGPSGRGAAGRRQCLRPARPGADRPSGSVAVTRGAASGAAAVCSRPAGSRWRASPFRVGRLGAYRVVPLRRATAAETGPVSEESESLALDESLFARFFRRPATMMFAVMSVLALIADRHLLELDPARWPVAAGAGRRERPVVDVHRRRGTRRRSGRSRRHRRPWRSSRCSRRSRWARSGWSSTCAPWRRAVGGAQRLHRGSGR